MGDAHDEYENPLATRYAGEAMRTLFSARAPHRDVAPAVDLARGGRAATLGLAITEEQIAALECAGLETIDFEAAARYEKRFRHDVMAHVHAYGDVAPAARADHPPRRDVAAT